MGGKEGARGYVFQALACVIESLHDNNWDKVYIEFKTDNDKVDIAFEKKGRIIKTIQVKSSINLITSSDIKIWLNDLINDYKSEEYDLFLIGAYDKGANILIKSLDKYYSEKMDKESEKALKGDIQRLLGHKLKVKLIDNNIDTLESIIRDSLFKYLSSLKYQIDHPSLTVIAKALNYSYLKLSTNGEYLDRDSYNSLILSWLKTHTDNSFLIEISNDQDFRKYYRGTYQKSIKDKLILQRNTRLDEYNIKVKVFNKTRVKYSYNYLTSIDKGILWGKAGSGKSLLIKKVFLLTFANCKSYSVFIDLKAITDDNIVNIIKDNLEHDNVKISKKLVEQYLDTGKFFLFFDGFDEINDSKKKMLIKSFLIVDKYNKNRIMISSRYNVGGTDLTASDEYKQFFVSDLPIKIAFKRIIKRLTNKQNSMEIKQYLKKNKIESFLANPLKLVFFIELLESKGELNITDIRDEFNLYERYIDTIIKWDKDRIDINVLQEYINDCIQHIAFNFIKNATTQITYKDLDRLISNWFMENQGMIIEINDIKEIILNSSILRINDGKIKFDHRNLNLYLAYKYINNNNNVNIADIFKNPLFNDLIIWISQVDNTFIHENLVLLSEQTLEQMLKEVENAKVIEYIPYVKRWLKHELDVDLENKVVLMFERFKYDSSVLDLVFEYLKEIGTNDFGALLEDHIIYQIIQGYRYMYTDRLNDHYENYCVNRWTDEGINNKLIKIISLFILNKELNNENPNERVFFVYKNSLLSGDEELVYYALLCIKDYIFSDYKFSFLGVTATSVNCETLIKLVRRVNPNMSKRICDLTLQIIAKNTPPLNENYNELSERIKFFERDKDYNIGIDFLALNCVIYDRDKILDILGSKKISQLLAFSLNASEADNRDIIKILDGIYFFNLDDESVLEATSRLLCKYYSVVNDTEEEILEYILKVLCGRVTDCKLKKITDLYNLETNYNKRILLCYAMWIIIQGYSDFTNYNGYCKEFDFNIRLLKQTKNLTEFIRASSQYWNLQVYIKDYDNDSSKWNQRYKRFFFEVISRKEEDVFKILMQIYNENRNCKCMLIEMVECFKNNDWLKKISEIEDDFIKSEIYELLREMKR